MNTSLRQNRSARLYTDAQISQLVSIPCQVHVMKAVWPMLHRYLFISFAALYVMNTPYCIDVSVFVEHTTQLILKQLTELFTPSRTHYDTNNAFLYLPSNELTFNRVDVCYVSSHYNSDIENVEHCVYLVKCRTSRAVRVAMRHILLIHVVVTQSKVVDMTKVMLHM